MKNYPIQIVFLFLLLSCQSTLPPEPIGPLPSERQLEWHQLEFYAFVHFNMNTFSDMEWGFGDESPQQFNPSELDCNQWARICKEAGMKGIILTAKHHDGFCLWPSQYTEHSVKNSPWKNGEGDVVKELAEACKKYGLKMGIYLSPWDRNHADYGTPEYITYFRNQLRELLTNYGEVFEVWFDGANGGTGYYGGANENRHVDRQHYYDWENTRKIVRELQPMATMFSDAGPDVRWVGNESGWAGKTNWCLLRKDEFYPGSGNHKELTEGHEDGTDWIPAEVDVSIRPGWYYHQSEDHKVRSLKQLVDIYYHSIGRNASFLLNFPVDQRGLIHERDEEQLMKMARQIRLDLAENLATKIDISASNVRGNSRKFSSEKLIDGNPETYWATDDDIKKASIILDFGTMTRFNRFLVQEYIPLGQRIKKFNIETEKDGKWQVIAEGTTIGNKRILRFPTAEGNRLKFNIIDSKACPVISNLEVYHAPKLLAEPLILRDKEGLVSINAFDEDLEIRYTTDDTQAGKTSILFKGPFTLEHGGLIRAIAVDSETGEVSPERVVKFDIAKKNWKVVRTSSDLKSNVTSMIDDVVQTVWTSDKESKLPQYVVIDLGAPVTMKGFTYLPNQGRWITGTISEYEFYTSSDGIHWGSPVSTGEFSNIKNNPVLQEKRFDPVNVRYIKFVALKEMDGANIASISEIGILTQ